MLSVSEASAVFLRRDFLPPLLFLPREEGTSSNSSGSSADAKLEDGPFLFDLVGGLDICMAVNMAPAIFLPPTCIQNCDVSHQVSYRNLQATTCKATHTLLQIYVHFYERCFHKGAGVNYSRKLLMISELLENPGVINFSAYFQPASIYEETQAARYYISKI